MSTNPNESKSPRPEDDVPEGVILLEHEYDGIREYDQRLPNWWLITLYFSILFSLVYWFFFFHANDGLGDAERLGEQLAYIEARNLEATLAMLNDDNLWQMSRNVVWIEAGRTQYRTHCAACHGQNLEGGIGFPLVNNEWVHGGRPVDIYSAVNDGIAGTGMQAWGGLLGPRRVAEVTAYVMSYHSPNGAPAAPTEGTDE